MNLPIVVSPDSMVSVVIPACGHVALTDRCIQSIRRCSELKTEIVLIDNGSTPEESRELAALGADFYWEFDSLLGYPLANNLGISVSSGTYVCLMNNDVEVMTPGWDRILVQTLESYQAAVVSPVTDSIGNQAQHVTTAAPTVMTTEMLIFVCVLMRRSLFSSIGMLDLRFGRGNYEDFDFSLRVRETGGKLAIQPSVFVHHEGSQTTIGKLGHEYSKTLDRNLVIAYQKHQFKGGLWV